MKTVKFAILGCGKAGTKHVTGLDGLKYAKIEAVCDIDKLRAERMGKKYKCKHYYNIDE